MNRSTLTRREALLQSLAGAGLLGLRSLASGLPIAYLLDPVKAFSDGTCLAAADAQYLIVSTSGYGDALNCNVPGTYDLPASFPLGSVVHPDTPEMAPTVLTLSGASHTAAKPWATLPQAVLDRTCFFHHPTQTANHGDQPRVMKLMGAVRRQEMILSLYAKNLAPCFHTVQKQPIALGNEVLSYEGQYQPRLTPTGIKALLANPAGLQLALQKLRDADLDRINLVLKQSRSTKVERAYLDKMALSQQQVRTLSTNLADDLIQITSDDAANQATAAALLIKMNVSPVVTVHFPFSGDNHTDVNWANESSQHVSSLVAINQLMAKLKLYGLQDKVTFAMINVFGRELGTPLAGRGHNAGHHVTVMIGKKIKGGVIGGVKANGSADDFDAATGKVSGTGDVPAADGLASMGLTLGRAIGLPESVLADPVFGISQGKVVTAALA